MESRENVILGAIAVIECRRYGLRK